MINQAKNHARVERNSSAVGSTSSSQQWRSLWMFEPLLSTPQPPFFSKCTQPTCRETRVKPTASSLALNEFRPTQKSAAFFFVLLHLFSRLTCKSLPSFTHGELSELSHTKPLREEAAHWTRRSGCAGFRANLNIY